MFFFRKHAKRLWGLEKLFSVGWWCRITHLVNIWSTRAIFVLFVFCVLEDNFAGESIFFISKVLLEKQNTFLDILTVRLVVDFEAFSNKSKRCFCQLNKPHPENHNRVELLPSFDLGWWAKCLSSIKLDCFFNCGPVQLWNYWKTFCSWLWAVRFIGVIHFWGLLVGYLKFLTLFS